MSNMLKLKYTFQRAPYDYVILLGSPEGIRDLYWQLTRNYKCEDGTGIFDIRVSDLDGNEVTREFVGEPYAFSTRLDNVRS